MAQAARDADILIRDAAPQPGAATMGGRARSAPAATPSADVVDFARAGTRYRTGLLSNIEGDRYDADPLRRPRFRQCLQGARGAGAARHWLSPHRHDADPR